MSVIIRQILFTKQNRSSRYCTISYISQFRVIELPDGQFSWSDKRPIDTMLYVAVASISGKWIVEGVHFKNRQITNNYQ